MENMKGKVNLKKTEQLATSESGANAVPSARMMLFFGGAMAFCCVLPLLLASGFSLAWLSESPMAMVGAGAAIGFYAWRTVRQKPACRNSAPPADLANPKANP